MTNVSLAEFIFLKKQVGDFTINGLNAINIILWKLKCSRIYVSIGGKHQCSSFSGVGQTQGMSKLMGSHKKQVGAWKQDKEATFLIQRNNEDLLYQNKICHSNILHVEEG